MFMGVYSPAGGVPYHIIRYAKGAVYIQAWASALLVLTDWAMQEPLCVERVTKVPRFFIHITKSYGHVV